MAREIDLAADFSNKPDEALVDDKTVAAVCGTHRNTIWRWSRSGKLPAPLKVSDATTRWRVGDIRKHLASLKSA